MVCEYTLGGFAESLKPFKPKTDVDSNISEVSKQPSAKEPSLKLKSTSSSLLLNRLQQLSKTLDQKDGNMFQCANATQHHSLDSSKSTLATLNLLEESNALFLAALRKL
ncbi:hypothetical protein DSO57_1036174 [Entomophthora muscae]|uniref:Uncharacterized protein n=1 Tax=Entomophthora muscae TaxID=34485 RepID=A0ACC2TL97_9FUNG|nr:hypothetical protein DSO57_1036174 [Entomophthora muscae]